MPFLEHRLPNDKSEQNFCKMSNDGIISDSFPSLLLSIIVLMTKKSHGCRKNAVNLSPTRGLSKIQKERTVSSYDACSNMRKGVKSLYMQPKWPVYVFLHLRAKHDPCSKGKPLMLLECRLGHTSLKR